MTSVLQIVAVVDAVETATTVEDDTTQASVTFGIFLAPNKCRKGYQIVGGRCRLIYD